jgi:hypothetical protein
MVSLKAKTMAYIIGVCITVSVAFGVVAPGGDPRNSRNPNDKYDVYVLKVTFSPKQRPEEVQLTYSSIKTGTQFDKTQDSPWVKTISVKKGQDPAINVNATQTKNGYLNCQIIDFLSQNVIDSDSTSSKGSVNCKS